MKVDNDDLRVYSYRWLILLIFIFAGTANALVLLSFSPISNLANDYWHNIGTTAINLLAVSFQIMYLPGTSLALYISNRFDLRMILLSGGGLTTIGCAIRYIGVLSFENSSSLSAVGSYVIVLIGTCFVALAQPFYINMPAKIASAWFAVKERDISTTLCSLANPLGSAVGSFIPALVVSQQTEGSSDVHGVQTLLLIHFIVASAAFVIALLLFRSEPPTAPSYSAMTMQSNKQSATRKPFWTELSDLLSNKQYLYLLFAFTVSLSNLNALAALLNQLPGGYSNTEIGLTGSVLIMSGFVGALMTGFVLDATKAYRKILKFAYLLAFIGWCLFMSSCRPNNFILFVLSASLLGFALLPTIPATIVNSVEVSFPAPEDLSVGLLYIGANTTAIAMTFIGQILLSISTGKDGNTSTAPFFPYGIWVLSQMCLALIPIFLFEGKYLRLDTDRQALLTVDSENVN